jgi:hypothetical protein
MCAEHRSYQWRQTVYPCPAPLSTMLEVIIIKIYKPNSSVTLTLILHVDNMVHEW